MAVTQYRSVQAQPFPGLATVGYQLFDPDGTANGSRVTDGIVERGANTGSYGGNVVFPDNFRGELRWDSGDDPLSFMVSQDINLLAEGVPSPVYGENGVLPWVFNIRQADATTPLEDAAVYVSSDADGATRSLTKITDALGNVGFLLDAGTLYVWVFAAGWNFTNPTEVTIA